MKIGSPRRLMGVGKVTGLHVRRATANDAQAIGAVFDAAVAAGWSYMGDLAKEPMFPPEEWDREVADHAPPNVLMVATEPEGHVIGFVAAHPSDCELFLLFVHPSASGRGVGRTLLDAAHDALRAAGCTEVFLYTHEQNERAQRVYERAGYRADGTIKESDFRGTHIREPRFVKKL